MASSNFFELLEIKKPLFDTFIYVIYRLSQAVSTRIASVGQGRVEAPGRKAADVVGG